MSFNKETYPDWICGTDFAAWKAQWDAYISLSGLADEDVQKQVQALTICFSCETLSIV